MDTSCGSFTIKAPESRDNIYRNKDDNLLLLRQSVEHLSWMGLFKDDSNAKLSPKPKRPQLSVQEEQEQVRRKFLNMR